MPSWRLLFLSAVLACPLLADARTPLAVSQKNPIVSGENVILLLKSLAHPKEGVVARIKEQEGKESLSVDGQQVLVAPRIDKAYSMSTNGVIAVVAYSSEKTPLHLADVDERGRPQGSIGRVWIKRSGAQAFQMPLPDLHVTHALLSPDGRYVAFTARPLKTGGFPGKETVYLAQVEVPDDAPVEVVGTTAHMGSARPILWKTAEELQIFVSDNETGAKPRIETFAVTGK